MKSSDNQLKSRGYVKAEDVNEYTHLNKNELLEVLKSKEPYRRTIAVNLLSNTNTLDSDMIELFCSMLLHEKKLYTKIELCNALSKASVEAAKNLVNYLGVIGNNQYKKLPDKKFNKKSYPLPRDIIARTLAHMGIEILPELMKVLKTNNIMGIREAVDAIGFICFYNNNPDSENTLNTLIICLNEYYNDDVIRWKIVRALESFNSKTANDILNNIKDNDINIAIRDEAKRSLNIIKGSNLNKC